ncbi:MAG: long-chain acyl-CoA synthetase [Cognaticolwellia sp.]|jgi:long-chain acyl-CoA synthetase
MSNLFWNTHQLALQYNENTALIIDIDKDINTKFNNNETQKSVNYQQLEQLVNQAKIILNQALKNNCTAKKQIIMMVAYNTVNSIVYYLAALQLRQVIWWVDKDLSTEAKNTLIQHYHVNLLINDGDITALDNFEHKLHSELALLISTSGSTGSPSLVRLSYQNLQSNCESICHELSIQSSDSVITTLPLQYSFGLSIINTHLNKGATIVLNEHGLLTREFWQVFKSNKIRCLYGVPFSFDMLLKLNLLRLPLQSLRYFAVAGGKLISDKVTQINQWCLEQNKQFFVMYGQTEATARISILSPEKVADKPQSIGQAISGGKLWLKPKSIELPDGELNNNLTRNLNGMQAGELCYSGANVMMGLANIFIDFNLPPQASTLYTGDLAVCDQEGDFTIVGRIKRFVKVIGKRINLDDVEAFMLSNNILVVCTGKDDKIECYLVKESLNEDKSLTDYQELVCQYLGIHATYCHCYLIGEIPRLASGKIDYPLLTKFENS